MLCRIAQTHTSCLSLTAMAGSFSPSHHPTCAPLARPAAEQRKGAPVSSLQPFSARRCTRRERRLVVVLLAPLQTQRDKAGLNAHACPSRPAPPGPPCSSFPGAQRPRSLARASAYAAAARCPLPAESRSAAHLSAPPARRTRTIPLRVTTCLCWAWALLRLSSCRGNERIGGAQGAQQQVHGANSSLARPDVARGHGGRVSLHKTAMGTRSGNVVGSESPIPSLLLRRHQWNENNHQTTRTHRAASRWESITDTHRSRDREPSS